MEIQFTFFTITTAIIKLFILMLLGYVIYHKKFIDDKFTDMLGRLLVSIFFPALIISKTVDHFSFDKYPDWWYLPVAAFIFSAAALIIGAVVYKFLKGFDSKREFMCSAAFQNCGYLPMNLILFSFSGEMRDRLLIYVFLYTLGFNVLVWSFVPLFFSGKMRDSLKLKVLLNPPVLAIVFSLLWVALKGEGGLPHLIADPIRQLGQAAFPIAMLTLGAYLSRYQAHNPGHKMSIAAVAAIKLFVFPALVLFVLTFFAFRPDYKFFLFLQSIMPTAVSLVFISSYKGGDSDFLSGVIFYTHLIAVFSIPFWLMVYRFFFS
ncbi:MAG: AEC family transporter [Candidatus Omnitrophota bacterium]